MIKQLNYLSELEGKTIKKVIQFDHLYGHSHAQEYSGEVWISFGNYEFAVFGNSKTEFYMERCIMLEKPFPQYRKELVDLGIITKKEYKKNIKDLKKNISELQKKVNNNYKDNSDLRVLDDIIRGMKE